MSAALSLDRLRSDVAEVLDQDPGSFADDDNLFDLGLDSVRVMFLVTRWRAEGFDVDYLELAPEPTVAAWWRLAEAAS